ncbi:hypothetical protein [Gordonia crocea]|uniref:Uncharacterized protein n=1 Tax=Gordonia crocea TaxID=589162 RepID=A0A7I9UW25_9ACTN|nr:hypothetical protein [Gordonia crocea]GED97143.1 hypothetical protein nbrc107697_11820 [Gordonia crocea]
MKSGIKKADSVIEPRHGWGRRVSGAGLAGVALTAALATAVPAATNAATTTPAHASTTTSAAIVPTHLLRADAPIVWHVSPVAATSALPTPALPAGALDAIPGRHEVASPEVIGQSAGVGAIIGGVAGGVIGFIGGAVAAPVIGVIATTLIGAGVAAACAAGTGVLPPAGVACAVLLPLAIVIAAPVTTIAAPLIGAVIGAGIGAAIGGGVGAAIGASYASSHVPAPKQAAAAKRVATTDQGVAAPKVLTDITKDTTVKNIINAADKAASTRPELAGVREWGKQFLPQN